MLNVAVGISAGIAALVSAVPALHAYTLLLCLGVLTLLTLVNLRGIIDAGRLFALPTYVFVGSFLDGRHARRRRETNGGASRKVHRSHHCWRIFTCAGSCWDGRCSG